MNAHRLNMRTALLLALALPLLAGCATMPQQAALPDFAPYAQQSETDAAASLADAIAKADAADKKVLAIFGANWCHDSRTLAGWLQTPRFQALVERKFELVYIDAGKPQSGEGHNLELAAAHGVSGITGTPSLLVLDGSGKLLNTPEDAKSWRNAASRSEDATFAALEGYAELAAR